MLEDINSCKHQAIIGPVLIHQQLKFSTFNYFFNMLISSYKQLRNILAVGTDGDEALMEALACNFPFAWQLRCFYHFEKNIKEKLRNLGIPSMIAEEYNHDIHIRSSSWQHKRRRISRLCLYKGVWFEAKCSGVCVEWSRNETEEEWNFIATLSSKKALVVRHNMLKYDREAASLCSPPAIYTTYASESMNAAIKRYMRYKGSCWPEFNEKLRKLVNSKHEEIIRSLSGRGMYCLM